MEIQKSNLSKIESLVDNLVVQFKNRDSANQSVSNSNVAWHLDHCLKVIIMISNAVVASNPEKYQFKFNFKLFVILLFGRIPRGKGTAPKAVMAVDVVSLSDLEKQLIEANKALQKLNGISENHYFNHPYFGMIAVKNTIRFLEIHTQHHLKIIGDIVK